MCLFSGLGEKGSKKRIPEQVIAELSLEGQKMIWRHSLDHELIGEARNKILMKRTELDKQTVNTVLKKGT